MTALHFSYCMTAVCSFIKKYQEVIEAAYPDIEIVHGTHKPIDKSEFQRGLNELLIPTIIKPQHMNDIVSGTLQTPGEPLKF